MLYYLPEHNGPVTLERLAELGLGYAFETTALTTCRVQDRGPDGGAGMIVAASGTIDDVRVRCEPDRQRWRRLPKSTAWVGCYADDPPGPKELLRRRPLGGRPVELADGREWLAPIVRSWQADEDPAHWVMELPTTVGVDDEGNWTHGEVVPRYQALWEVTRRWWQTKQEGLFAASKFHDDEDDKDIQEEPETIRAIIAFSDLYDAALRLLQANYRIGLAEVALLGLFDSHCAARVLDAAVDWDFFVEYLKKKADERSARGSSNIAAGPPA